MLFCFYSAIELFSQVGGDKDEYTYANIDGIHEEWSLFVANFIFT